MSDNGEADTEEPAVQLGEGATVEGAPTARVAARLYFPIEASEVRRREGETPIRTPDGSRDVADVLAESDEVYFPDRQSFVDTVQGVIGTGPVPTEGDGGPTTGDDATGADEGSAEAAATTASEPESTEPENAAEAPEGEQAGAPDEDNAAEAPADEGGDEPAADADDEDAVGDQEADADDEAGSDESLEDEGGFEFDDPAE